MSVTNALNRIRKCAIVPVVVMEDVANAVPTAEALLSGGIDVMEITFRTDAALESIRTVSERCHEMLVGAGTVTTLEQCKKAIEAGAKIIVMPGFRRDIVEWCVAHDIAVTPGCVTPTEIMAAVDCGVSVLKFFPAGVYGGLKAMKALSDPFVGVKFIPTGGVSADNMDEFLREPFVFAVGGSWVCPVKVIREGRFDEISALCKEARNKVPCEHS